MTFAPRLEEITPGNFETATAIRVHPDQEFAVSPVMQSLAEAYVHPAGVAWPRRIVDGRPRVGERIERPLGGRGCRGHNDGGKNPGPPATESEQDPECDVDEQAGGLDQLLAAKSFVGASPRKDL